MKLKKIASIFIIVFLVTLFIGISKSFAVPWTHRRMITIDSDITDSTQTNIPIYMELVDATEFRYTSNSGHFSDGDSAQDVKFASDRLGYQQLDHNIVEYYEAGGELYVEVKIPSLSHTTDTIIYMFYGATSAPDMSNAGSTFYNPSDDDCLAVWDIDGGIEDGITYHDYDLVEYGTGSGTNQDLHGRTSVYFSTDWSSLTDTNNSYANSGDLTVIIYAKLTDATGDSNQGLIFYRNSNHLNDTFGIFIETDEGATNTDYVEFLYGDGDGEINKDYSMGDSTVDSWHQYAMTVDGGEGGTVTCYVDGSSVRTNTGTDRNPSATEEFNIGRIWAGYEPSYIHGWVDGVKIYTDDKGADFIETDYRAHMESHITLGTEYDLCIGRNSDDTCEDNRYEGIGHEVIDIYHDYQVTVVPDCTTTCYEDTGSDGTGDPEANHLEDTGQNFITSLGEAILDNQTYGYGVYDSTDKEFSYVERIDSDEKLELKGDIFSTTDETYYIWETASRLNDSSDSTYVFRDCSGCTYESNGAIGLYTLDISEYAYGALENIRIWIRACKSDEDATGAQIRTWFESQEEDEELLGTLQDVTTTCGTWKWYYEDIDLEDGSIHNHLQSADDLKFPNEYGWAGLKVGFKISLPSLGEVRVSEIKVEVPYNGAMIKDDYSPTEEESGAIFSSWRTFWDNTLETDDANREINVEVEDTTFTDYFPPKAITASRNISDKITFYPYRDLPYNYPSGTDTSDGPTFIFNFKETETGVLRALDLDDDADWDLEFIGMNFKLDDNSEEPDYFFRFNTDMVERDVTIRRCVFDGADVQNTASDTGIYVNHTNDTSNIQIYNSYIYDWQKGIHIVSSLSPYSHISSNTIFSNYTGIDLNSQVAYFDNNAVTDNTYDVSLATGALLRGNTVKGLVIPSSASNAFNLKPIADISGQEDLEIYSGSDGFAMLDDQVSCSSSSDYVGKSSGGTGSWIVDYYSLGDIFRGDAIDINTPAVGHIIDKIGIRICVYTWNTPEVDQCRFKIYINDGTAGNYDDATYSNGGNTSTYYDPTEGTFTEYTWNLLDQNPLNSNASWTWEDIFNLEIGVGIYRGHSSDLCRVYQAKALIFLESGTNAFSQSGFTSADFTSASGNNRDLTLAAGAEPLDDANYEVSEFGGTYDITDNPLWQKTRSDFFKSGRRYNDWASGGHQRSDPETFYVASGTTSANGTDCATGSDANNGTSDSTPWKTTKKVEDELDRWYIVSGDTVLFEQGCKWQQDYTTITDTETEREIRSEGNGGSIKNGFLTFDDYEPAGTDVSPLFSCLIETDDDLQDDWEWVNSGITDADGGNSLYVLIDDGSNTPTIADSTCDFPSPASRAVLDPANNLNIPYNLCQDGGGEIYKYYNDTIQGDTEINTQSSGDDKEFGQCVQIGVGEYISGSKLYIKRTGSSTTREAKVEVYAGTLSGSVYLPTGSVLATSYLLPTDKMENAFEWVQFSIPDSFVATVDNWYCFVFRENNTIIATDYTTAKLDTVSPTGDGNYFEFEAGTEFTNLTGDINKDLLFEVYTADCAKWIANTENEGRFQTWKIGAYDANHCPDEFFDDDARILEAADWGAAPLCTNTDGLTTSYDWVYMRCNDGDPDTVYNSIKIPNIRFHNAHYWVYTYGSSFVMSGGSDFWKIKDLSFEGFEPAIALGGNIDYWQVNNNTILHSANAITMGGNKRLGKASMRYGEISDNVVSNCNTHGIVDDDNSGADLYKGNEISYVEMMGIFIRQTQRDVMVEHNDVHHCSTQRFAQPQWGYWNVTTVTNSPIYKTIYRYNSAYEGVASDYKLNQVEGAETVGAGGDAGGMHAGANNQIAYMNLTYRNEGHGMGWRSMVDDGKHFGNKLWHNLMYYNVAFGIPQHNVGTFKTAWGSPALNDSRGVFFSEHKNNIIISGQGGTLIYDNAPVGHTWVDNIYYHNDDPSESKTWFLWGGTEYKFDTGTPNWKSLSGETGDSGWADPDLVAEELLQFQLLDTSPCIDKATSIATELDNLETEFAGFYGFDFDTETHVNWAFDYVGYFNVGIPVDGDGSETAEPDIGIAEHFVGWEWGKVAAGDSGGTAGYRSTGWDDDLWEDNESGSIIDTNTGKLTMDANEYVLGPVVDLGHSQTKHLSVNVNEITGSGIICWRGSSSSFTQTATSTPVWSEAIASNKNWQYVQIASINDTDCDLLP